MNHLEQLEIELALLDQELQDTNAAAAVLWLETSEFDAGW